MHGQQNIKFGDTSANTKCSAVNIQCFCPRLTVLLGLHVVYYVSFYLLTLFCYFSYF
jgi:hypothetical protein